MNPKRRIVTGKYDPAKRPFPRMPAVTENSVDRPVGNSRNQRRARAELTYAQQLSLAEYMGFELPPARIALTPLGEQQWISIWEASYARL